jgi:hypothetical protein
MSVKISVKIYFRNCRAYVFCGRKLFFKKSIASRSAKKKSLSAAEADCFGGEAEIYSEKRKLA